MVKTQVFNFENKPSLEQKNEIINFLFEHLGKYGDPKNDIGKAIDYALMETKSFGGFVMTVRNEGGVVGAVVINQTGMRDYIPENILVYIAIHEGYRGSGLGKQLMRQAMNRAEGDIALHVEPDNPARFLYEGLGFSSKYVEMRLKKA